MVTYDHFWISHHGYVNTIDNFGSLFENKRTKKLQMIYIDQWWNLQLTDTANNWK